MLFLFRANSGSKMRSITLLLLLYLSIAIAAPTRDTNCSAFKEYEQKWNLDQSLCPEVKKPINDIGGTQLACLLYNTTFTTLCTVDSSKINPEEINNQTNKIKTLDEACKSLETNVNKIEGTDVLLQTIKALLQNNKACEKMCSHLSITNKNIIYNPINQCIASAVILSALHRTESTSVEKTETPKNYAPSENIINTSKLKTDQNSEQPLVVQPAIQANIKSSSQETKTTTTIVPNNVVRESNDEIQTKPEELDKTQNKVEQPISPAQNAPKEQSPQSPSPKQETQQQAEENVEEDLNQETNFSENIAPQINTTQKAVTKETEALPSADGNVPNDNQYVKSEENELGPDGDMEEEVFREPFEQKEKPPVTNEDSVSNPNYPNQPLAEDDSYFFSYFMMVCILFVLCYVGYHNKQKILALLLEGRRGKKQQRRRPNSANYHKLDSNLEEAVTSACNKNSASVIY